MNVENVDYIGSNPSLGTKVWFTGCKFLHGCVKSLQEMLFEQDFENLGNICQKFEHHENFPTFVDLYQTPPICYFRTMKIVSSFWRFHVGEI